MSDGVPPAANTAGIGHETQFYNPESRRRIAERDHA